MCDARRNEMRSTTLYTLSYPAVFAFEAMKRVKGIGGDAVRPFILAYTPDFCGFVDWREAEGDGDGKFLPLDKGKADGGKAIENIFELRCFCPAFELRWVREGIGEVGRAALLSESSLQGSGEKKDISALDGHYLLWGRGTGHQGGIRLCDHRIGELPVPVSRPCSLKNIVKVVKVCQNCCMMRNFTRDGTRSNVFSAGSKGFVVLLRGTISWMLFSWAFCFYCRLLILVLTRPNLIHFDA